MEIFTIALFAVLVGAVVSMAWDRPIISTLCLVGAFVLSDITFVALWAFICAHWIGIIGGIIGYLLIGAGWSLFKWALFCKKRFNIAKEKVENHQENLKRNLDHAIRNGNVLSAEQWQRDLEAFQNPKNRMEEALWVIPKLSNETSRIAGWVAYWPFSVFWTGVTALFDDFFVKFVRLLKAEYQAILDRSFRGL